MMNSLIKVLPVLLVLQLLLIFVEYLVRM